MLEARAVFGGMPYHWPVNAHSLQKCSRGTVKSVALLMDSAAALNHSNIVYNFESCGILNSKEDSHEPLDDTN